MEGFRRAGTLTCASCAEDGGCGDSRECALKGPIPALYSIKQLFLFLLLAVLEH